MNFSQKFDGVWACASLLHVGKDKLSDMLKRVFMSLKENGILYASFKYGTEEREKDGRYFVDLDEASVREMLEMDGIFRVLECGVTGDVRDGRSSEMWVNVVGRKIIKLRKI